MAYNLELSRAVEAIEQAKPKRVLVQLPDGLKPRAREILAELRRHTDADCAVWAGSCFGACDVPVHVRQLGFDLLIAWGHSEWRG